MTEGLQLENSSLALALMLVAASLILLWVERMKIKTDVTVGAARCFIQLIILGYIIDLIFDTQRLHWMLLMIAAMIAVGAHTSRQRAKNLRNPWSVCFIALLAGTVASLGFIFIFGIVDFQARYLIPLAGIVIGNATRTLSISLERLGGEMSARRSELEVALSLGASPERAAHPARIAALGAALIPSIDGMKIIGLVQLPGAMLGMLMAGAAPIDAVKLQIIVIYLLLASNTIAIVVGMRLAYPSYFTPAWQLRARQNH